MRAFKSNQFAELGYPSYLTSFIHLSTPPPLTFIRTSFFFFFFLCKFQFLVLHSICFIKIDLQTLDLKGPSKLRWMPMKVVHDSEIIHLDQSLNSVMTVIPLNAGSWCVQNEDIFKFIVDP